MTKTNYRKIAEKKYGLKLKNGEGVHHIDMNKNNNDPDNLWVFRNRSEHGKAHSSIINLIPSLIRRGFIVFDEWEGVYKFPSQLDYSNLEYCVGKFKITEEEFNKLPKKKQKIWYEIKQIFEEY